AVMPAPDITKCAAGKRPPVEERVEEADGLAHSLIEPRGETRPERRHRTRASVWHRGSIDADEIAAQRAGVAGDIRDAAADADAVRRHRDAGPGLVARHTEE